MSLLHTADKTSQSEEFSLLVILHVQVCRHGSLEGVLTAQTAENAYSTFKQISNAYFASPTSTNTWLTFGQPVKMRIA